MKQDRSEESSSYLYLQITFLDLLFFSGDLILLDQRSDDYNIEIDGGVKSVYYINLLKKQIY